MSNLNGEWENIINMSRYYANGFKYFIPEDIGFREFDETTLNAFNLLAKTYRLYLTSVCNGA